MKKCQTQRPKKPTLESLGFLTVDGIAAQEARRHSQIWVQILALTVLCCVPIGKLPNLSELQVRHL